ncbi:hypothetical protein [Kitasatospora sp. NBC_01266]|uniref:hypothetical protein n=1 Tax=Kitasatospora sp. NBC_01266 TaxID=2903572 RepID=UPI002E334AE3|nr:hypothetical protein [Kitasatospora sp. NBC_01266]
MTVTAPRYPILLFDEDQWLIACESVQELQLAVEPDFLDDIATAFDALARPVWLTAPGDRIVPELAAPAEDARPARPARLQEETEKYFYS